jgi:hypothetical protein
VEEGGWGKTTGHLSVRHGVEASGMRRRMCNHTVVTRERGGEGSTYPVQKWVKGRRDGKEQWCE